MTNLDETEYSLRLFVPCAAECEILKFVHFKAEQGEEHGEVYITSYLTNWDSLQDSHFFRRLWQKLKMMWYIFRGKDYLLYELLIHEPDDMEALAKFFKKAAGRTPKIGDTKEKEDVRRN